MQDFFQNVSRYPRYMISLIAGIFWFFFEQLQPFLKKPVTAIAVVGFFSWGVCHALSDSRSYARY